MEDDEVVERQLNDVDVDEFRSSLDNIVEALLNRVGQLVNPEKLGFDRRTASTMWRGPTWIAIPASQNGSARYYGGLEYVDASSVVAAGSYVFYFNDSERIMTAWSNLEETRE